MKDLDTTLVSIIIPLFNAERYIAATIQSALNQTWANKEIIVIDDGSTDDSLSIALTYSTENVRVVSQPNQGASAARNTGLSIARGVYIQFLDCDDLLSTNKLEEQVKILESNPGKVAMCKTIHFINAVKPDNAPSLHESSFVYSNDDPANFLIKLWGGYDTHGAMISVHSWLTPKTLIDKVGKWDIDLTVDDDGEYFSRVLLHSTGVISTNGIAYYRKQLSSNTLSSRKTEDALKSRLKAIKLKTTNLLKVNNGINAQIAVNKLLSSLAIDCYPDYPTVYQEVVEKLPRKRISYLPNFGSRLSNGIAYVFGWKMVVLLKRLYHK